MKMHTRRRKSIMSIAKVCSRRANPNHLHQQSPMPPQKLTSITQHIYLLLFIIIVTFVPRAPVNTLQLPSTPQHDSQPFETRCLACMRSVTSAGIDSTKRCEGYYCGPYQFSYQYWAEAGKPGKSDGIRDFEKCARDINCAESTVRAYFKKFKRDCNQDGSVDCLDMAALHKAGPTSCSLDWFYKSRYWQAFNRTSCAVDRELTSVSKAPNSPAANERKSLAEANRNANAQRIIMKNQTLTSECLDCICEALTSCGSSSSLMVGSNNCGSGTICGPFAISQSYWKDGRRPGASWTACARTKECSSVTIRNYMEKHKRDCTGDGFVTCEDYAAIHRRGPKSCMNRDLLKEQYWTKFLACRANQKPKDDASMVKVSDDPIDQLPGATGHLVSRWDSAQSEKDPSSGGLTQVATKQALMPTTMSSATSTPPITTSSPLLQSSPAQEQTPTRLVRPTQMQEDRFEFSSAQPAQDGEDENRHRNQQQTSSLSPVVTYELNPIVVQTKPPMASNQMSLQTSATTSQQLYEYSESIASSNENDPSLTQQPQQPGDSLHKPTNPLANTKGPNSQAADTSKVQSTAYHHEYIQQPPAVGMDDYNSLPTIIVGKPLGPISTNRNSQSPSQAAPSAQFSHDGYSIDRQYQTTMMAQQPTTMIMQPAPTTIAATSQLGGRLTSAAFEQPTTIASSSLTTTETKPSQPSTAILMNQEEPVDGDYLAHDLGPNGFDRVVNNIVASPDFSKTYPPMPDHLIQQRKQPVNPMPAPPPRGPSHVNKKEQTSPSDQMSGVRETTQSITGKRENSKTLSVMNQDYNNSQEQHPGASSNRQQGEQQSNNAAAGDSSSQQSSSFSASSIVGPDALNMTNLFDKGLNESSKIPSECLDCICDASSNCDTTVQCISKQREKNRCGLYMISWNQYKESDISLTTMMSTSSSASQSTTTKNDDYDEKLYYECSTDKNCAEKLIHLYIEKYSKDCNHDGKIDCYDIAAIHRVGPDQCNSNKFLGSQYWRDFNHCYATDRLTTTIQPPVASQSG